MTGSLTQFPVNRPLELRKGWQGILRTESDPLENLFWIPRGLRSLGAFKGVGGKESFGKLSICAPPEIVCVDDHVVVDDGEARENPDANL